MTELPPDVHAACKRLRQGDIIRGIPVVEMVDLNRPLGAAATKASEKRLAEGAGLGIMPVKVNGDYACLVSQTCDIVQPSKHAVIVASVVPHADPADPAVSSTTRREKRQREIDSIKSGRRPHLIHFDSGSTDFPAGGYVDLRALTTVQKPALADATSDRFLISTEASRRFAFRCGHIFDRPAIPETFEELVRSLRGFLLELETADRPSFERLRTEIADEWLWLDDHESPTVGQLFFLGEQRPSDATQRILGEWWEEAQGSLDEDVSLLANEFTSFEKVSLADGRSMSLLTHWYLSEDA